jgi:hypothetical protein
MNITSDDAYPVFLEVARVRETLNAYCLHPDVVPASLDDIEYAILQEYGAEVEKKTWPFKSDRIRGLIRIYDPRTPGTALFAQTVVDSELNDAQNRYYQTKELCHILLHHQENCTTDPTEIIAYFVRESTLENGVGPDIKNESLADLAAYELLFPRDLRDAAKARIEAGEDTIFGVADWLGLPQHVVETILDDPYSGFAKHVWERVDARDAAAAAE